MSSVAGSMTSAVGLTNGAPLASSVCCPVATLTSITAPVSQPHETLVALSSATS